MNIRGFKENDLIVFANKLLQDMRSSFKVETIEQNAGSQSITFVGPKGKMIGEVSDFGFGDIGFKSLEIDTGEHKLKFNVDDRPALSARILPSLEDFKSYLSETNSAAKVESTIFSIQALGDIQLTDEAQVIKGGKAYSIKEFEVDRPRPAHDLSSVSYGS